MEEFIALHNRTVSRSEIERVISIAKEQNNTEVIYRLSRILNAYPTEQRFVINIKDYPAAPTALAGAHHTGDYREALDENGRLRKGYKFVSGKIIPPQPSHLSDDELTFLAAAGIDYFEQAPDDEAQGLGKPIPAADIYKMITDKIIKMLKSTKASDYKKTWEDDAFFIPLNFDSKKPYRGVNRMLLQERIGLTEAFANPYFLTFKQIKKHKGTLKKGAKGYEVVYYSIRYVVPADKNSGRKAFSSTNAHKVLDFLDKHKLPENIVTRIPMIRYYNVYNGEDITGIDFKLPEVKIGRAIPETASENEAAQLIVEKYPNPPAIKHGGNEAYYKLSEDLVRMPKIEQFDSVNDYYRTIFHELTHSTRHESRLNREKISFRFGDSGYAKEELVAEFGAVFLSAWAGIMWYNNKNHAAYLKGWNGAIKEAENDNKFLMKAASLAQAATDYILNLDATGQPAFLSKYEKTKPEAQKAPKETKTTTALKFSDTETNKKMIEGYRNSSTGKINLLKTDMIGTQFHLSMFEKYMAIDDIAALYGKGRKAEAQKDYAFVKEHIEWAFNHNLRAAKEYDTIEQCTERFIELLPNLLAKGGQWLEAKANSKNSATAKGQFTKVIKQAFDEIGNVAVGEKPNKAEKPKPEAKKATEKADNTDKKYKFIAFYNSYGRINGIYSYQNLTINEFYLKNTFDDGIKVYAPLKSLEKIEEAKRIIEKQYIEGKDFVCLKFESKKREEYYSLLIHSNESPKPEAPKATEKADNTDKKYKFIAFYNVLNEIVCLYSYQELTINEFYLKNTFDNGIKVYAPLRFYEKIEETKRKIEKQYTEGKDFICLIFESEKSEEYYSLLIHSNEKPKPEAPEKAITVNESNDLLYFNVDRSNPQPQPISLVKAKYNSDFEKEYSRISDKKGYFKPTFNNKRNLQILRSLCSDFIGTINTHDYIESAPKSKTTGIMSLKKIVSKDKLRPTLTGVYIDKDYYIATDAFKLIWLPRHKNDEYKTGWILDLNFKCQKLDGCKPEESVIDGRFPIDSIIKMKNAPIAYTSQQLDIITLLDHLYRGEKAIKSLAPYQIPMVIALRINKEDIYMDIKNLLDALDVLRANGAKSLTMNFENLSGKSPIHILTNNHLQALIMPRYFATEKDIPTVNTCLMIAPLPLTLTEISKPTKGLSAPTDGTLFGTLPIFKTLKEAKKYFKAWAYTHLRGKKVFHKELDKYVVFSSKGIDHVLSSKISLKKMYLIQQAEEMLKNSHLITFSEDYKGRDNIKGAYRMRTTATFEGEEVKVILTLREGENGVVYYDHKIEEIEESTTPPRKSRANPFCGDSAPTNIPAKTVPNKSANKQIDKLAVSIKEKSTTPPRRGRAKSFCGDSAPTNTPAKTMPNTLANRQIDKLANPIMPPTVYVEHLPEISTSANQNTLDAKMAALQTRNWETFVIANPQLQRFLGDVERKTSESTVITIAGGAGSGKTRFAFQFINALAQNYKVGHASLEEHPDSKLYYDKVQQYIDETALPNIEAPEIKDLDQLEALIQRNEVIVIDSFAKLQELNPRFLLDRDLRKKYDGKLFLLIYQLTGEGKMRGGSKSEFDGDIILLTHVAPDYRENYIYPSKNRYNALPATQLRYSTYFQQMLDIPKELGTGRQPTEAISLPPAPQTNVYEVIY